MVFLGYIDIWCLLTCYVDTNSFIDVNMTNYIQHWQLIYVPISLLSPIWSALYGLVWFFAIDALGHIFIRKCIVSVFLHLETMNGWIDNKPALMQIRVWTQTVEMLLSDTVMNKL